ncbi:beta-N-acetylhexosaminidase [Echinicola sp. CAU 1574]|uniref:beta-N-acetylhexosaminidase n=1 Tax=Echinicola arenosa TaxID=2774144 RepID=A0ABR9AJV4_9BACT|nr:beta-N-acetylhexosaminidase [Echinicola arenosa]MBD8488995.1 beta-N-acetylhexosaminidase [Echinicola arenosa]
MKDKLLFFILILSTFACSTKSGRTFTEQELTIIPKPNKVIVNHASMVLEDGVKIIVKDSTQKEIATLFSSNIQKETGLALEIAETGNALIRFETNENLPNEAYQLEVSPEQIVIKASGKAGWFYGTQTLRQLITQDSTASSSKTQWLVPGVIIDDQPRFSWRAYMLDEARYFQGEEFVKTILDQMALLKMNVFHWHLTDDAGWRIEIKKYPLLTQIGSQRNDSEIGTWKSGKTSGEAHGGFYTQDQIKDIVAYAAARNITIVPEFEMPGHSSAAIAAYTWLGTAGKDIDVPVKFGRHYDNYDVTKPEVIGFTKDVLSELFELFPSEVIHIGGDEVGYKVWEESPHVQEYMKTQGIKTPADLQINFTNKISQFIEENGRRMMGWNEIMGSNIHQDFGEKKDDKEAETALAKNVVVHFWKGNLELATEAAEKGYGIVNSLHSNTYLDYSYKSISLQKAYNFDPIPEGLSPEYHQNVYGSGCQMWTEWAPTNEVVEYQTFPRIAAFAEVDWTMPEKKDFASFKKSLQRIQKHWDNSGINYAPVLGKE